MENASATGRAVSLADMDAMRAVAKEFDLPVHLDGARIFNAAAALGCSAQDIAARADSVMFCMSKGLCAPVGSLLAGTKEFVDAARFKRKVMGGGMRQAGILAAAGIIALSEHTKLVAADHARAKKLAQGLAKIKGVSVNLNTVDINMVFFSHPSVLSEEKSAGIVAYFAKRGIIISPPEAGMYRFVTHYWIGDAELDAIIKTSEEAFRI
ncbi:MAG: beta-eliminating lyase-related protein, partial [Treponema sp.]|nr:beta-eliminating lyase-related protein [Treponema sp.]